jgi:multiple sugar transport system substrate-binding protein
MARTTGVLLAVAALSTLSACAIGSTGPITASLDYDPDASLSGRLSVMGFSAGDEAAQSRLDLGRLAVGRDVEVSLIEGELNLSQFLSSVASGNPPEVLYVDRDQIGSLAARGAIIPVDDCITGERIETSQFVDSALGQVSFNGSVYGIPEFNSVQLVMANPALLRHVGLTIADVNGSSWEAVTAANQALYAESRGALSVIGFDSKLPELLPLWAKANGAELISADGRTAQLNMPAVVDALEWAVGVYDDQGGYDAVAALRDSADFFGGENQFATNAIGAMPMDEWYLTMLNEVSPNASLAFDTVRDRNGESIALATGSAWVIPYGGDNPQAACRWAATMTSVDAWLAAANASLKARTAEGKPFTGVLTANAVADARIRELVTVSGEPWESGVTAMYTAN